MNKDLRGALERGPQCPHPEALLAIMDREPQDAERRRMEAHVEECTACQSEIALFRGFMNAEVRPEEREAVDAIVSGLRSARKKPERHVERWWQRFLQPGWGAGVAVAMAAIILMTGLTVEQRMRHAPELTASKEDTLRSTMLKVTSPTGDLKQLPSEIVWEPVIGATAYAVTLTEVDGTQIFYSKVTAPPLLLPPAVHKLVTPGKTLRLRVLAEDGMGRELATSGTLRIRLKPQVR